jgi:hypothetical protein
MNDAAGLTLAAILALTARFQAGVDAMKAGDPAKAAAEMSAVLKANPRLPELAAGARLLRGQALKAQSKPQEALEDFRWLATRDVAPDVRKKAREEFTAAGGKPASLVPELPPLAEWKRMQESIREGEGRRAWDWMTAKLRKELQSLGEMMGDGDPDNIALWFTEDEAVMTGQAIDEEAGTARLTFRENGQTIHVAWVQDGTRWKIDRLRHEMPNEDGDIPRMTLTDVASMDDDEWGDDRPPGARKRSAADPDEAAKVDALAPALKAEIEACVARLGADDAAGRTKARTRLKELGATAHPLLRKYLSDPDPEIAATVRELLATP